MARVAARPFEFAFEPASTALVVIDMQRDFLEKGGFGETLGNDVGKVRGAIPVVRKLLEACRKARGWCTASATPTT